MPEIARAQKEICGVLHVRVPCSGCECLIWVVDGKLAGGFCERCVSPKLPRFGAGTPHRTTPWSEVQYNGRGVDAAECEIDQDFFV